MVAVGFHYSTGGNKNGSGDFIEKLNAVGIPVMMKGVGDAGLCFEAQQKGIAHGVDNVLVYRATNNSVYQYDTPDYTLPPAEAALKHWNATVAVWPPELDKAKVWMEPINEPRKQDAPDEVNPTWNGMNTTEWLGLFMVEYAKLANPAGYKVTGPSFATGEPGLPGEEVSIWEQPGMLEWLRYMSENPTNASFSGHEYDLYKQLYEGSYPYNYGRFQAMIAACDKNGIARTFDILITEHGWEKGWVPTWDVAKIALEKYLKMASKFPQVKAIAMWTLQLGWDNISDLLDAYIALQGEPLVQWVKDNQYAPPSTVQPTDPAFGSTLPGDTPVDPDPDPDPGEELAGYIILLDGSETALKITAVDIMDRPLTTLLLEDVGGIDKLVIEPIRDEVIDPDPDPDPGDGLLPQPEPPQPGDLIIDLNAHRTKVNFDALVANGAKGITLRTSNGLGTDSTTPEGIDKMLFAHLDETAARKLPYDLYHFVNTKATIEDQIELYLDIIGMCIERVRYLPNVLYLDFEAGSYTAHADIEFLFQYLNTRVKEVFPDYSFRLGTYSSASWWNPKVPSAATWPQELNLVFWQAYYTSATEPMVIPGPSFRPPLMNGSSKTDVWQWSSVAGTYMGQTLDPHLDINYQMPIDDMPVSSKFSIGDRVVVTAGALNVRDTPSGTSLGTQTSGAKGMIVGGPVFANNYHRWQIDFDAQPDGWCAEDWLEEVPQIVVPTLIGLHASADGGAGAAPAAEPAEFGVLKPNVMKFQTINGPELIGPIMDKVGPNVVCIVRPYLSWGGRNISPEQFRDDTVNDYKRTIDLLLARGVPATSIWAELHNEPNLTLEGWTYSWGSGTSFANWGLQVLDYMRPLYPAVRWIYPGLSPGIEIPGLRTPAAEFLVESSALVNACEALGVHAYWAANDPRSNALAWVDTVSFLFPGKPIWITEASYKSPATGDLVGNEYYQFVVGLNQRASVLGVTFYVASATNQDFYDEVWVRNGASRGIAQTIRNLMP